MTQMERIKPCVRVPRESRRFATDGSFRGNEDTFT